ncbi:MAG: 50S ribosomal protein L5 [Kiritimatiellae bacterium]|nr:50S ribosomal protein L5 [Kiritimatiellia bacterium]MCO5044643.1 50S ribosomal protein L5 [Kiritimatiellia bacterium]MCO5068157.1 50S ribosomal protein L5 [Kiritimatiellia bacterium]
MSMLQDKYRKEIAPQLQKSRGYENVLQIPRLTKVVVNMGINSQVDKDTFKVLVEDLGRITGQRAQVTRSTKSVANFKLREGQPVGARVTLRGARMYEFLERMINAALPRIRDFRGISPRGFDGRGSYSMGLKEQTIFPEIDPDQVKKVQGMDITLVTTAKTNEEARELLKALGMPFAAN